MNARDLLDLLDVPEYLDMTVGEFVELLKAIEADKNERMDALVEDEMYAKQVSTAHDILGEQNVSD